MLKITHKIHVFFVPYFQLLKKPFAFNGTFISLLFHVVPTTSGTVILWDGLFYSLALDTVLTCVIGCRVNCFHLAIIFKSVNSKLFLRWKRTAMARRRIPLI